MGSESSVCWDDVSKGHKNEGLEPDLCTYRMKCCKLQENGYLIRSSVRVCMPPLGRRMNKCYSK